MSIFVSNFQPDSLVLQLSTLLKIGEVITDNKKSKYIPHLRMICFNIIKKIHSLLKTNPHINDSCIYNTSNVQQTLGFDQCRVLLVSHVKIYAFEIILDCLFSTATL